MTTQEKEVALAELAESCLMDIPNQLPNSNDLNILHTIAFAQQGDIQTAMRPYLFSSCGQCRVHIHTADQFCEALLRAAKKWKD